MKRFAVILGVLAGACGVAMVLAIVQTRSRLQIAEQHQAAITALDQAADALVDQCGELRAAGAALAAAGSGADSAAGRQRPAEVMRQLQLSAAALRARELSYLRGRHWINPLGEGQSTVPNTVGDFFDRLGNEVTEMARAENVPSPGQVDDLLGHARQLREFTRQEATRETSEVSRRASTLVLWAVMGALGSLLAGGALIFAGVAGVRPPPQCAAAVVMDAAEDAKASSAPRNTSAVNRGFPAPMGAPPISKAAPRQPGSPKG